MTRGANLGLSASSRRAMECKTLTGSAGIGVVVFVAEA